MIDTEVFKDIPALHRQRHSYRLKEHTAVKEQLKRKEDNAPQLQEL
jgi:hypothetical protein